MKRNQGWAALSGALNAGARCPTEMGLPESEGSVTVKINRGAFPAWFYFAPMKAVGTHSVRLHEAD